jgi:uncharacterized protein
MVKRVWKVVRWVLGGAAVLVAGGVAYGAINFENNLSYMLLSHQNFPVEAQPAVLKEFGATAEVIDFASRDQGLKIQGWWIPAQANRGTLIVLHGLGATRQDHLRWALPLWRSGFNLVLIDLREHGGSAGEFFTYGFHEWQDVAGVIDTLEARKLGAGPIVVLGISAGGSVAVSAAAHDQRIAGLITIGAFADLSQTIERQTPWLSSGMRSRGMRRAETMAQFDIAQASPQTLIAQVKGPKLIMHGQLDDYIPFQDGEVLFAAATGQKALYPIPGANHATMLSVDRDRVRQTIVDFVGGIR